MATAGSTAGYNMIIKFYVAFTSHVIYKLMSFVNFYVWSCDHMYGHVIMS